MKIIVVPNGLLQLPYPWCITSRTEIYKQLQTLPHSTTEINTALTVFEHCLEILLQLTCPVTELVPEDILTYWGFSTDWIAEKIPTVEQFELSKIQEFLQEQNVESIPDKMVEELAEYWIWSTTHYLANTSSQWLEKTLTVNQDATAIASFLDIVTRYWQQTDRRLAGKLIIRSTEVAGKDAIPLLEAVENTSTDDSLRELAQSYHNLILDNAHLRDNH
jgi:hypothetical protein